MPLARPPRATDSPGDLVSADGVPAAESLVHGAYDFVHLSLPRESCVIASALIQQRRFRDKQTVPETTAAPWEEAKAPDNLPSSLAAQASAERCPRKQRTGLPASKTLRCRKQIRHVSKVCPLVHELSTLSTLNRSHPG